MLEYTNEDIKRQLKQYQLQQPFFNILRNELQQAQQAITDSLRYTDFLPADSRKHIACVIVSRLWSSHEKQRNLFNVTPQECLRLNRNMEIERLSNEVQRVIKENQ